jgi:predicted secreted protein
MAVAGHTTLVQISADDVTYTSLDGCNSVELQRLKEVLETTDFAGGSYRERILGLSDSPVSVSGDYERADTASALLETVWGSGATAYVKIMWDGTNGHKVAIKVENFNISSSYDGKVEMSCSLVSTGAVSAVP